MTALQQWWQQTRLQAQHEKIPSAEVDYLVQQVTGLGRLDLVRGEVVSGRLMTRLTELWQRRVQDQVPIQYLVGQVSWRDFVLLVQPGVLIPRPETELLVDWVIEAFATGSPKCLVDVGTGSGCLACAFAKAWPEIRVIAVDTSTLCLDLARRNVEQLQLTQQVELRQSDWLASVSETVDLVVSNPPYIPTTVWAELEPQVREHEPRLALDGGSDGLMAYRHLVNQAPHILRPDGLWAVEVMQGQAEQVIELLEKQGQYYAIETKPDLEGNARFVLARLQETP